MECTEPGAGVGIGCVEVVPATAHAGSRFLDPVAEGTARRRYELRMGRRRGYLLRRRRMELTISGIAAAAAAA